MFTECAVEAFLRNLTVADGDGKQVACYYRAIGLFGSASLARKNFFLYFLVGLDLLDLFY